MLLGDAFKDGVKVERATMSSMLSPRVIALRSAAWMQPSDQFRGPPAREAQMKWWQRS